MCKGQFLVTLSEIEHNVCQVVLSLVHKDFLNLISCNDKDVIFLILNIIFFLDFYKSFF